MSHQNHLDPPYFNELADCDETASKWALSFCGCGFLGAYHIGVLACIREKHPKLMDHVGRYLVITMNRLFVEWIDRSMDVNGSFL